MKYLLIYPAKLEGLFIFPNFSFKSFDIVFNKVKTAGMAFGNGKVTRGFILFKVCSELMH